MLRKQLLFNETFKKIFAVAYNKVNTEIADPSNGEEYYTSYFKRKKYKIGKNVKNN